MQPSAEAHETVPTTRCQPLHVHRPRRFPATFMQAPTISAFVDHPTQPSTICGPFGEREKVDADLITSARSGLMARSSNVLDRHGAQNLPPRAHVAWPGKSLEMADWTQRDGFGVLPEIYATSEMDRTMLSSSACTQSLSMSACTVRMVEHPLAWRQARRDYGASDLMSVPRSSRGTAARAGGRAMCATYGLHSLSPATPRGNSMPRGTPRRLATFGSPRVSYTPRHTQKEAAASPRATWRGSSRPFPQSCAFQR